MCYINKFILNWLAMIKTYKITNINDLHKLSQGLKKWVFRGQANSEWKLASKLERSAEQLDIEAPVNIEKFSIQKFKQQAHQTQNNLPYEKDTLDWVALLQHYGGSTRLLDFTESIYVATYFALQDCSTEAAIWAVNERPLEESMRQLGEIGSNVDYDAASRNFINSCINNSYEANPINLGVGLARPYWVSERQSLQQGLFLVPYTVYFKTPNQNEKEDRGWYSFLDNLAKEFNMHKSEFSNGQSPLQLDFGLLHNKEYSKRNSIIKFVIPDDNLLRTTLRVELRAMNISARTLFPGIEGLAKSCDFPDDGYKLRFDYVSEETRRKLGLCS